MKLLADENFPPSLISYLQKKRHNVKRIQRSAKGISDVNVYEKAAQENRIIITFDKDFLTRKQNPVSVMIFDFPDMVPDEILPYLDMIIQVISSLKRRKKNFIAVYSKKGLEMITPDTIRK